MTLSDFRHITDELLSAYIDGEVTEQERALVEAAVVQDEQIAWRLNSLRQTVVLLRELPDIAMPRSFALTLEHLASGPVAESLAKQESDRETIATPGRLVPQTPSGAPSEVGFWDQLAAGWRDFWQGGNTILRNAAAVSFALMLMLTTGGLFLTRSMQTVGTLATAPSAAPAAASESVALAPTSEAADTGDAAAASAPAEQSESQPQQEAQIAAAGEEPGAESARTLKAPDAETESTEQSEDTSIADTSAAESAPAQEDGTEEGAEPEVAAAAALSAPEQPAPEPSPTQEMPPLVAVPMPGGAGGGPGMGGGGMGGGGDAPPGAGGGESLVPEVAHTFDIDPLDAPTQPPMDESARIAAAPAEESTESEAPAASSAAVAAMEATPAVDAVEAETEESDATVSDTTETEASESETTVSAAAEPTVAEPTATPEAVALAAPEVITSSEVVEVVGTEGVASATNVGIAPEVLWIAQGGALLLTVVLGSLWWRSRTPRRPNE